MSLRNTVSLCHPCSTTDPASILIADSKLILDSIVPAVLEVVPSIKSPTSNSSDEDIFKLSFLLFQLSTFPTLFPDVTCYPSIKLLLCSLISNWGKYFWGTITPAEFKTSWLPGYAFSGRSPAKL